VLAAAGLLASCAGPAVPPPQTAPPAVATVEPTPPPAPEPARPEPEAAPAKPTAAEQALEEEVGKLRQLFAEKDAEIARLTQNLARLTQDLDTIRNQRATTAQDLEDEVARLRLLLLDRGAQVKGLSGKLDTTIQEVVRALAKLRSLEGKAEAASNLAEAEIALRLLERPAGREKSANLAQAEQLVQMGAQEFKKENYSGALYLTSQAKGLVKGGDGRTIAGEAGPKVEGEVPFSLPVPLRLLSRSNIREGPGPSFRVVFVAGEGAPLTGQAYKGRWVRVRGEDGRGGWIYYNLVGER